MSDTLNDIRFIKRADIDTERWDATIRNSFNGMLYAQSFYLDIMAKNWAALILNDYEAVMPLTWNRKFGISYLYQPPFAAQLGIFSKDPLLQADFENFIKKTKAHFRFAEIHLNYANALTGGLLRANYILNLSKTYPEIRTNYKKRLLENLGEANGNNLTYLPSEDYETAIRLFRNEYGNRFPHVSSGDYQRFERLCLEMKKRNLIFLREVKDAAGNSLTSSIFFKDEQRIYNIMSVTMEAGREKRSHFLLIDRLIMEFSSQELTLDFEGSEVAGIAEFYRKFGTINQPYPFFPFNHLPFLIRLFK